MDEVTRRFQGLGALIDEAHEAFDLYRENDLLASPFSQDELERARLAAHEWLANLVQHACFDGREPVIELCLTQQRERLRCIIKDNSEGFDIGSHLEAPPDILKTFPERGMGLVLLKSSTSDLSYHQVAERKHRLEFYVDPE